MDLAEEVFHFIDAGQSGFFIVLFCNGEDGTAQLGKAGYVFLVDVTGPRRPYG